MIFSCVLAVFTVCWVVITIYLLVNTRKIGFLKKQPLPVNEPSLAIVVAMRNEEAEVEKALTSLCELQYYNYRIIAINDRSTDGTAAILEKLAARFPQITAIHIQDLPPHWLGKNHALYKGYQLSSEEWILFTDADIQFEKNAIRRAMGYVQQQKLDHLAVLAQIQSRSAILNSFFETFGIMLTLKLRLWEVQSPHSKASVGIGAFNLVKRTAYEKAGTHEVIKLRPDDDLKLGEKIKQSGGRQGILYGEDAIELEWYTSVREFINGLMKNTFSVSDYNTGKAVAMALATFVFFCFPVPAGLLSGSLLNIGLALTIVLAQACLFTFKTGNRNKWWHFLMAPVAGAVMTYIVLRSTWLTLKNGGIYWRDSFYSLKELKSEIVK
ncbi:MAG: glycosyltransferase family 2 protein [Chitinophagaceae bacterium]